MAHEQKVGPPMTAVGDARKRHTAAVTADAGVWVRAELVDALRDGMREIDRVAAAPSHPFYAKDWEDTVDSLLQAARAVVDATAVDCWCQGQFPGDKNYRHMEGCPDAVERSAAGEGEACICPRFTDTGGFRVADLCCPVHGAQGTNPGDGMWEADPTALCTHCGHQLLQHDPGWGHCNLCRSGDCTTFVAPVPVSDEAEADRQEGARAAVVLIAKALRANDEPQIADWVEQFPLPREARGEKA